MSEIQKSQAVRLVDVWLLGPFFIWAASQSRLSRNARALLLLSGLATIAYNGANYFANRQ